MTHSPTPTQLAVLRHLVSGGHDRLVRFPGGFWTTTPVQTKPGGIRPVPVWWITVRAVDAMVRHGWLRVEDGPGEPLWKRDRVITAAGLALGAPPCRGEPSHMRPPDPRAPEVDHWRARYLALEKAADRLVEAAGAYVDIGHATVDEDAPVLEALDAYRNLRKEMEPKP